MVIPFHLKRDDHKDEYNLRVHGISFEDAQKAFLDEKRVILDDTKHSSAEQRFFCLGTIADPASKMKRIVTVRFTMRNGVIRIFGAGFWRKGKVYYEKENNS
jgi:uncharacterized protein